jgi:hypothetical protein
MTTPDPLKNPPGNPEAGFSACSKNVFSQHGEDGIVEKILELIPGNHWCAEFGAWDGVHFSNTRNLIKNKGFKSVLIEPDRKKFKDLQKNLEGHEAVLINKFVMFEGADTLDDILSSTAIPADFDFLSIDVDGNDYYIFASLTRHRPRIICVEYNPTIPNEIEYVQPRDFNVKRGASALALVNLARSKGYELVAATYTNLIFVDKILFPRLGIANNQLTSLRDDRDAKVFAFVCYDGTIHLSRPLTLLWHDLTVDQSELQALPAYLRRFSPDYSFVQKILFKLFLLFNYPARVSTAIKQQARKLIG